MIFQDLTRATGLGFCLSQVGIMVFVMLYYSEPHTIIYTTHISNSTNLDVSVSADEYGLAVTFLITSALTVVFSMMTTQLQEAQAIDNMIEFNDETAAQVYFWSAVLWSIVMFFRFNLVALLCSPVNMYYLLLVVLSQTYAIQLMCAPRCHGRKSDTVSIVMYMFVVGIVYAEMKATHGLRLIFWSALIMADILLMVGHTYDSHCNTETIANCRVFYCCFATALLILLYIV
jgi:hypothetical protein